MPAQSGWIGIAQVDVPLRATGRACYFHPCGLCKKKRDMPYDISIDGICDSDFTAVREAREQNLADGAEGDRVLPVDAVSKLQKFPRKGG